MAFSVTTTYTRSDPSVEWWDGTTYPGVNSIIVNNFIYPRKILSENCEFIGANIKKFTRIFDSRQSWEELTTELINIGHRAQRNAYCGANGITISVETQDIDFSQ